MDFSRRTFRKAKFASDYWGSAHIKDPVVELSEANVVCSDIDGTVTHHQCQIHNCPLNIAAVHKPVLDIDVPVMLIPSSTEGHSHLYIDKSVSWDAYCKLLDALVECGIVERGYVQAAKNRGFTSVRLPWVKKKQGEDEVVCGG